MVLQLFYVGMGVYGWWQWRQTLAETGEFHVNRIAKKLLAGLIIFGMLAIPLFGYLLDTYTDSDLPYWDSYTTVFSFIATWMMARRFIQNWVIWIVVDASCVAIYSYKGLNATALLFVIYTLMAIYGLYHWNQILRNGQKT